MRMGRSVRGHRQESFSGDPIFNHLAGGRRAHRPQIAAIAWAAAIIIICAAFLAIFLWALPALLTLRPHLAGAARDNAINSARIGIAAILAVLGTAGGLWYTIRTYRLARQGQLTEQYTKAIEQLSNASKVIRMGGIYALEQTTRQSAEYRHTVIDVLAAYIRVRSPWRPSPGPRSRAMRWSRPVDRAESAEPASPEPDIRVALSVLRHLVQIVGKRDLDLSYSDLSGADLMGMYLLDARLNGANLMGAKLNGAYMVGADLQGALLTNAQFYKADFTDVRLQRGQTSPEALNADDVTGLKSVQWLEPPNTTDALQSATSRPPPSDRRHLSRLMRKRPKW
jgi:hypothetical protein